MSLDESPPAAVGLAGAPGAPLPNGPIGDSAARGGRADRTFRGLTKAAAVLVLVIIVAIAVFLVAQAIPALRKDSANFLTTKQWNPDDTPSVFGVAALTFGTLLSAALALLMAVPVALGVALFISHYAPRRLAWLLGGLVDLLAAVPSVVYGLWGLLFLVPHLIPLSRFLDQHAGWFPPFSSDGVYGKSIFAASVVLAVMILPIIAAISREVFLQAPRTNMEAALALGATRWEMIRLSVLPYGRPGVISAAVLGFGRALGETIAVALVLSANYTISWKIFFPGGNTIAANIANAFGDAGTFGRGALIASGLELFAITLVVNIAARAIVARRAEFSGAR